MSQTFWFQYLTLSLTKIVTLGNLHYISWTVSSFMFGEWCVPACGRSKKEVSYLCHSFRWETGSISPPSEYDLAYDCLDQWKALQVVLCQFLQWPSRELALSALGIGMPSYHIRNPTVLIERLHGDTLTLNGERKEPSWAQPCRYPCQGTKHVSKSLLDPPECPRYQVARYHQETLANSTRSWRTTQANTAQLPHQQIMKSFKMYVRLNY